ncbi:MAG: dihydroneopterin aldolase [Parachlamydiaceae bacterium]|nr:dihydroneopterin aldolase [Parachlamydiaceae bacterium]
MKGYIGIDRHKIDCIIGVHPLERQNLQSIYVDLMVETDFSKCSLSDDVEDTVNYELLADLCTEIAKCRQFRLLETFAVEALHEIFRRFDVSKASICIRKPKALASVDYTIVQLELTNHAK